MISPSSVVLQTLWIEHLPSWSAESIGWSEKSGTSTWIKCSVAVSLQTSLSLRSWSYFKTFDKWKVIRYCQKKMKKLTPGFALLHFCRSHSLLAFYLIYIRRKSHITVTMQSAGEIGLGLNRLNGQNWRMKGNLSFSAPPNHSPSLLSRADLQ